MKKLWMILALTTLSLAQTAYAQNTDPKLPWASKVVTLQQGPELDRLLSQLSGSAAQSLIANWEPRLQRNVPKAKQAQVMQDLNTELQQYSGDIKAIINEKVSKVSADVLVPAYIERFSLDELKQIAAFFESPVIKKYQSVAPELGNLFVTQLIESVRPEVTARTEKFDAFALKIIGTEPAPTETAPAKRKSPGKK